MEELSGHRFRRVFSYVLFMGCILEESFFVKYPLGGPIMSPVTSESMFVQVDTQT